MRFLALAVFSCVAANAAPPAKYLTLSPVKAVTVNKEKPAEAVVTFSIDKGLHVQANPASKPNLIATTLTFEAKPEFELGAAVYPAGKPWRLAGAEEDISTYEGKVDIKFPIKNLTAKPGKTKLEGKLRYQACNPQTCFFPMTIPVSVPLIVK